MRRLTIDARSDWRRRVENLGLAWHTPSGKPYWNEAACYTFAPAEIAQVEDATRELYRLFLAAADHIVTNRLFAPFGLPAWCVEQVAAAWRAQPPALGCGRFDLGFDSEGPPKLLEFNCDGFGTLLETAIAQWEWRDDRFPTAGQFNLLHEQLTARWREIAPRLAPGSPIHFAYAPSSIGEAEIRAAYLADTARAAGLEVEQIAFRDIGWDGVRFVDLADRPIRTIYHLLPWEWLIDDPFTAHIPEADTDWIEPIWAMIWSSKAILPILWDLFPGHPNLLWASRERPLSDSYARKPLMGFQGANVRIVRAGCEIAATGGRYSEAEAMYQGLYDLPNFDGARPVIGSWVVAGEPAGIGVREDGLVTGGDARFVPHVVTEQGTMPS